MANPYYKTVFEIGIRSYPWLTVVRPFIFVAIGVLFAWLFKRKPLFRLMGGAAAIVGALAFLAQLWTQIPNLIELRRANASGKISIVEGVVENFHPAPTLGALRESFSVRGVMFSYNLLELTPCFHNDPPGFRVHGGPIREGLQVRISYNAECIQRVEIVQKPDLATR